MANGSDHFDAWWMLQCAVTRHGDREAILDLGNNDGGQSRQLTYRDLHARCSVLARFLATQGDASVRPGDRIAVMLENCPAFMEMHFAVAGLRAILVSLNFRLQPPEISYIVCDSAPRWLVAHVTYRAVLLQALVHDSGAATAVLSGIIWVGHAEPTMVEPAQLLPPFGGGTAELVYADALQEYQAGPVVPWVAPALPQSGAFHLYYTSGTTGRPKGVVLTHKNMISHAERCVSTIGYAATDIWLHTAPMFHLVDSQAIYIITMCGGKHVFLRGFQPVEVMRAIATHRITTTNLASTMVAVLMSNPQRSNFDLSSIRLLSCGGSSLAPDVIDRATKELNCRFFMDYGMTECSGHICISLLGGAASQGPAEEAAAEYPALQGLAPQQRLELNSMSGRAFCGMEVRVVEPATGLTEQPVSDQNVITDGKAVGEVVVRGDTVFMEYWQNPVATAESRLAASDGGADWFRTGDLAVMNEFGFINVVSRLKECEHIAACHQQSPREQTAATA